MRDSLNGNIEFQKALQKLIEENKVHVCHQPLDLNIELPKELLEEIRKHRSTGL